MVDLEKLNGGKGGVDDQDVGVTSREKLSEVRAANAAVVSAVLGEDLAVQKRLDQAQKTLADQQKEQKAA